jgi:hypothetical protein
MQPVILDTDVASLSHKGRLPDPLATRLIGRRPLITFITLGELTKWAEIRHWARAAARRWPTGYQGWSSFRATTPWPSPGAAYQPLRCCAAS